MNRRVVSIIIAVVLALAAGLVVFLFARSAENRAVADDQPVNVLVTTQPVVTGTTLQAAVAAGAIQQTQVPTRLRPAGAVEAVTAQNADLMAVTDVPASQIVLDGTFAASVGTTTTSAPLQVPEGLVAISVPFGDPNKVGPFLRPGSEIGIFETIAGTAATDNVAAAGSTTRLLIDKALVLAVGPVTAQTAASATSDAWSAPLVTVAVTQEQAEKLIQGAQAGTPYMALLGPNTSLTKSNGVSDQDLFK